MRGECACACALLVCALSLALAAAGAGTTTTEVNAKWLEDFRRELMRDSYDYEDSLRQSSTLDDRMSTARHPRVTDAPVVEHTTNLSVLTSSKPGMIQNKPNATPLQHASGEHALVQPEGPTGKPGPARVEPDAAPAPVRNMRRNAMDEAASREFGISRGDLYGGRSRIDGQIYRPRQDYMKSLYQLEQRLMPVYVRRGSDHPRPDPDPDSDPAVDLEIDPDPTVDDHESSADYSYQQRMTMSRKRLWDQREQKSQDRPPYIVQNGIKLYRVHTDPKERYDNIFGADKPLRDEWEISTQLDDGPKEPQEFRYRIEAEATPYHGNADDIEPQYNKGSSSEAQDGGLENESSEQDVSEYQRPKLRSRYVQGELPAGDYAQRYSARRDAALLADAFASSNKPCDCQTDKTHIMPEL